MLSHTYLKDIDVHCFKLPWGFFYFFGGRLLAVHRFDPPCHRNFKLDTIRSLPSSKIHKLGIGGWRGLSAGELEKEAAEVILASLELSSDHNSCEGDRINAPEVTKQELQETLRVLCTELNTAKQSADDLKCANRGLRQEVSILKREKQSVYDQLVAQIQRTRGLEEEVRKLSQKEKENQSVIDDLAVEANRVSVLEKKLKWIHKYCEAEGEGSNG